MDSSRRPTDHPRVVMLVRNSVDIDTRVRKEAASLSRAGYNVHVIGTRLAKDQLPETSVLDGIPVQRLLFSRRPFASAATYRWRAVHGARHRDDRLARAQLRRDKWDARARDGEVPGPVAGAASGVARVQARSAAAWAVGSHRLSGAVHGGRRATYDAVSTLREPFEYALQVRPMIAALRPDIIHAHDLNTLYAAWSYAWRSGAALVYDAHELERHRNAVWTPTSKFLAWANESALVSRAAATITVSEGIADEMVRMYSIARPVVVLNSPPLSAAGAAAPRVDLREQLGLGPEHRLVVYVGKHARGRGVDTVVASLAHLPAYWHAAVLGPRETSSDAQLAAAAETAGVRHRVHLVAPVPSASVPAFIRRADVSVNPIQNVCRSYDLSLPNKLFDAVFAGLPVVVGRLEEAADFVTTHRIGVVYDETEPAELAEALLAVTTERPPGLDDFAAMEALRREVSWEAQEAKLLGLYARLDATGR